MAVHFVGYRDGTLRVRFDGGEVYDYFLVPPEVGRQAELALANHDEGGFFRESVKGIYPYRRVS